MDAETFNDLALRVIAGEATADDRRALDAELASAPARRAEFEQLQVTHDILRATAPVAQAAQALAPGLPEHRVGELRTAVRQHFGPATNRAPKTAPFAGWIPAFRWLFAGSGTAAIGYALVIFFFANRTIEVGLYGTDLVRGGDQSITAADVPAAKLVTFEQDAPFDQWQSQPLAWDERAKIWIDNEHDLLHITRRVRHGQIITETQPLAPTTAAQREQIKQLVESLQ
jgi:hypothetical protein